MEKILYRHEKIAEVAVKGILDLRWAKKVATYVVIKLGLSAKSQEILEFCKKHLADFKCPCKVIFRESLPKRPTGKIQKYLL